jgi:glucose/arabinose dehydrogenase
MKTKSLGGLLLVLMLSLVLAACGPLAESVTPAPTAVPTHTATSAPPTSTPTSPSLSAVPTRTATFTPQPTATDTASTSETPMAVPTRTATFTPQPTATVTPEPSPSPTPVTAQETDPATVRVELQLSTGGLDRPVGIAHAGDGSGRLFVLEQPGRIRVVQDGALVVRPFLDIADRVGSSQNEQGLLGLAFHPRYEENGTFLVNYTDRQGDTVVSRFSVSSDGGRADPGSEVVLLRIDQPAGNHNGGHLAFGPDGRLYVGTGDGGGAGDQYGNGQNGQTLLGAMLRLGVDGGPAYTVPDDNPFVGNPNVRDEIWAVGLRNPWRYSFDRLTGDLYIADVGQNRYEEVNVQPAGEPGGQNYGWPIMEGLHCFPEDRPCEQAGLTLPVWEYDHSQGCSVTGGYVYRGEEFPILTGIYVFGDYCSGRIWGLAPRDGTGADGWQAALLAQADLRLTAFGEDERGELYLVDARRGELFKIAARRR